MFVMQLEGGAPICDQLCGRITELISCGSLKENEKLPAVREVAKSLGINPNTVQKAYASLEQQGLIYSIPAKGSYVSVKKKTEDIIRAKALSMLEQQIREALSVGIETKEISVLAEKIAKERKEEI